MRRLLYLLPFLTLPLIADNIQYSTNPSVYPDVTSQINSVFPGPWSETQLGVFQVVGASGTTTSVKLSFLYDDGNYSFAMGYTPLSGSLLNFPTTDVNSLRSWTYNAISSGTSIFDQVQVGAPPDYRTISLAAGTKLAFWIIPNSSRSTFLSQNSATSGWDPYDTTFSAQAWPLFSVSSANPGSSDQNFAFFGKTNSGQPAVLFTFEDLLRIAPNSSSDNDFNDLHFTVTNISPVPEFSSYAFGASFILLLGILLLKFRKTPVPVTVTK